MRDDNNQLLHKPDTTPYGMSFANWTAKWWQWVLSLPNEDSPVRDATGEKASLSQAGPVWFLAGTIGGIVERRCVIPAEKSILLPILNHGGTLADSKKSKTEQELQIFAKKEMDIISDIHATIDNKDLTDLRQYRVTTPIFDVSLPKNSLFDGIPGPTKGCSDGYWLFLLPLIKGKHEIKTFGSCLSGKIRIGVNYEILSI